MTLNFLCLLTLLEREKEKQVQVLTCILFINLIHQRWPDGKKKFEWNICVYDSWCYKQNDVQWWRRDTGCNLWLLSQLWLQFDKRKRERDSKWQLTGASVLSSSKCIKRYQVDYIMGLWQSIFSFYYFTQQL